MKVFIFAKKRYMKRNDYIENVILDLGGVIANLDEKMCEKRFRDLMKNASQEGYDEFRKTLDFEVLKLNKGEKDGDAFCKTLKSFCKDEVTLDEIKDAYISLISVPESRVRWIERIAENFNLYLLSDISDIHWDAFKMMCSAHGADVEAIFERCYLSYKCGMIKPSLQFYKYVVADSNIDCEKTIYFDDLAVNIRAARAVGIKYCYNVQRNHSDFLYHLF